HGDQQHQARDLEEIEILRVEDAADGGGVGDFGRHGGGAHGGGVGADHPGADHEQELGHEDEADQEPDREILQRALAELDEIDVEHHDHEEKQHGDRAD